MISQREQKFFNIERTISPLRYLAWFLSSMVLLDCNLGLTRPFGASMGRNIFHIFLLSWCEQFFFLLLPEHLECLLGGHMQIRFCWTQTQSHTHTSTSTLTAFRKFRNESEMLNINNSARPWHGTQPLVRENSHPWWCGKWLGRKKSVDKLKNKKKMLRFLYLPMETAGSSRKIHAKHQKEKIDNHTMIMLSRFCMCTVFFSFFLSSWFTSHLSFFPSGLVDILFKFHFSPLGCRDESRLQEWQMIPAELN